MLPRAVSFFVGRGQAIVSPGSASSSAPGTSTWRFGSASWSVAASNATVRTSRGFRPITWDATQGTTVHAVLIAARKQPGEGNAIVREAQSNTLGAELETRPP